MSFMPYIHFDGTCEQAMSFYASVFGATDLQMMRYTDAPPGTPGMAPSDLIMHAQLSINGSTLMGSDYPKGMTADPVSGFSVMTSAATVPAAQVLYDALLEGGAVIMPFGPTFWSPGFGMVKDRFGIHWIIGAAPNPA